MPSETTPILGITQLESGQSQPEVPVNQGIRILEAYAQLSVKSRSVSTPPGSPAEGDRYICGEDSLGDWAGKDDQVAVLIGGAWSFLVPQEGWIAWIKSESKHVKYLEGSPQGWFDL